eukprot:TRINITY_DN5808_c1_g1_i1.p1 TRINITY_DN5808_c1_g1~~TRINITY_DN5808_c1_g1_i1.p1  ORF type:complete len:455 (-),score=74.29 TRINITY_DN5808_c1_g1_i1:490-1854(-)
MSVACSVPTLLLGPTFSGQQGGAVTCQPSMGVMPYMLQTMTLDPFSGMCFLNVAPTAELPMQQEAHTAGQKSRPAAPEKRSKAQKEKQRSRQQCGKPGGSSLSQQTEKTVQEDASGRGVISLLQEFVQCSKQFPVPQHQPILQWSFDSHMAGLTTLEFRAQVSFLLDGVPHHVAGSWQSSKRQAQRDVAERCLVFFIGSWGAYLLEHSSEDSSTMIGTKAKTPISCLEEFCLNFAACRGQPPIWSQEWDGDRCRVFVELDMLGVPHKFAGDYCSNEDAAKTDTAKRVLWYFQASGYENTFEPDPKSLAITGNDIPAPPANWPSPSEEGDYMEAAQRKTALMRIQNRLQQTFGRQLKPGQSIWEWSYEADPADSFYKAKVYIPAAGQFFEGSWARSQREAQLETCQHISAFLDSASFESSSMSGRETPSSISPRSVGGSNPSVSSSRSFSEGSTA